MGKRAFASESQVEQLVNEPDVLAHVLKDNGTFPNSKLPLLVYRQAVLVPEHDPAAVFEQLFTANGWLGMWRNGIYSYHHYHSTAHEVLGVYHGSAKVQFGGERGVVHEIHRGDVIIIPAGVAHMNLGSTAGFGVVVARACGGRDSLRTARRGEGGDRAIVGADTGGRHRLGEGPGVRLAQ